MIAFMSGTVVSLEENLLILSVNGIGYTIWVSSAVIKQCRAGEKCTVHTHLQVRDDALVLYGFSSPRERHLFEKIITVSGAGPKTALAVCSVLDPDEILQAIVRQDKSALMRAPGVGRKLAERLILELKDKVDPGEIFESTSDDAAPDSGGLGQMAFESLTALGYKPHEAEGMVQRALAQVGSTADLQMVIKVALKARE